MDIEKFQNLHLQVPSPIEEIFDPLWTEQNIRILVKRDDLIHPIISGNKWRKLKEYIHLAQKTPEYSLLSFGGAYSNHLYSLAYTGYMVGLHTIGIIRGEELNITSNPYLHQMSQWGMDPHDSPFLMKRNISCDSSLFEPDLQLILSSFSPSPG